MVALRGWSIAIILWRGRAVTIEAGIETTLVVSWAVGAAIVAGVIVRARRRPAVVASASAPSSMTVVGAELLPRRRWGRIVVVGARRRGSMGARCRCRVLGEKRSGLA